MILTLALASILVAADDPPQLLVLPQTILLTGPHASQQLIVIERTERRGSLGELTAGAEFTSSQPAVASVDTRGRVVAHSDGRAIVTAKLLDGREAIAEIEVGETAKSFFWSFRNHVQPVMTKAGCNSGPCHGSATGQNHFKLSLRGYAPEADHQTLMHEALGRRVLPLAPAHSLLLLKPTLTIPHGGGKRISVDSVGYQILSEWIAAGAPPPDRSDPRVERLDILPPHVTLGRGGEHQLLVRAFFSDGHVEDVTRWAKYSSSDAGTIQVGPLGRVKADAEGEASVSVWYLNRVASSRITIPFRHVTDPRPYLEAPRHGTIDDRVLEKLQELGLPPSAASSDSHFVRRAYLDAIGLLPSAEEAKSFTADTAPDKRAKLIDSLLARPDFVDFWAYKWSDLLLVSSSRLSPPSTRAYYNWIRGAVAENRPWDQLVRQLVTALGSNLENGAANYYVLRDEATKVAENITATFMGLAIACARCHDHPLDRWTQDDYYSLSNYFSRVGRKGGDAGQTILFRASVGDVAHPRIGTPLPPRPLGTGVASSESGRGRRIDFAEWLTSAENPYFARSVVNRIWYHFMGRGLVDPVDDLRDTNPPSNQKLMKMLTTEFVGSGFDVKEMIRRIMNSATYQSSSGGPPIGFTDNKYYSRFILRRLPAEVILDIISQATGTSTQFPGYPPNTRALQLPDSQVRSYFLTVFGRPKRKLNSHAERVKDATVSQALHLINSEALHQKLRSPQSMLEELLKRRLPVREIVGEIFWIALSRAPESGELDRILTAISGAQESPRIRSDSAQLRREILEDFFTGVLMSKEFLFNH